jgi:hypothetical protein
MAPLVAVRDSVKVPVDDDPVELTDTVDVAGTPDEGVTGLVTVTPTPVGAVPTQEYVNETGELKPLRDVTVIVELPVAPTCIEIDVGAIVKMKSVLVGTVRAKA